MAKTQLSIRMSYSKAKREVQNMEDLADQIDQKREKMMSCRGQIAGCWKGASADSYLAKMDEQCRALENLSGHIRKTAQAAGTVAENTYRADQRALELAQTRSFSGGGGAW